MTEKSVKQFIKECRAAGLEFECQVKEFSTGRVMQSEGWRDFPAPKFECVAKTSPGYVPPEKRGNR